MILRRLGNKARLAEKILPLFPKHDAYIEMFFGSGALFWAKGRATKNFLNDLDDDVYNLWEVVKADKQGLLEWIELLPYNDTLFQKWRKEKETDPLLKAVRFLMLSNFSYLGNMGTMRFDFYNSKQNLIDKLKSVLLDLSNCQIMNCDFRKVFSKVTFRHEEKEKTKTFIYADPPYLGTSDNYQNSFKEADSIDLFQVLVDSKIRFAMSEFAHPTILELAKMHNLNTIILGERQSLKNRSTEILITNYQVQQQSLF